MGFITAVSRYILPFVTIMLLSKCIMTLLLGHPKEKVYGFIVDMKTGDKYALNMWETSIGRSNSNDVVLTYNTISRSHAVISRRIDGWYVYDLDSRSGIKVNGVDCEEKATIKDNDIISLSGIPFRFEIVDDPVQRVGKKNKTKPHKGTPGRDDMEPSSGQSQPPAYQPASYQPPSYQTPPSAYQVPNNNDVRSGYRQDALEYPFTQQDFYDENNKPELNFRHGASSAAYTPASDDIYSQNGSYTVETPASPPNSRQHFQPRLINKDTGEIFILCGNEVIIGSGMKCDIRLRSREVAKLQAVLILYEDGWAIQGTSQIPTYLNNHRVTAPQLLFDGDVIAMGDERLYYKTNR